MKIERGYGIKVKKKKKSFQRITQQLTDWFLFQTHHHHLFFLLHPQGKSFLFQFHSVQSKRMKTRVSCYYSLPNPLQGYVSLTNVTATLVDNSVLVLPKTSSSSSLHLLLLPSPSSSNATRSVLDYTNEEEEEAADQDQDNQSYLKGKATNLGSTKKKYLSFFMKQKAPYIFRGMCGSIQLK